MKKLAGFALAMLLLVGCHRYRGIDAGNLSSNFQAAEPALKTEADTAIKAIKAGNFPDALAELQKLSKRAKLSAEQQQAVKDVIAQIQKKMQDDAKKAEPKKK